MPNHENDKLVQICGLWVNTSKAGNEYMTGSLGTAKVIAFRNSRKTHGDNLPDWHVYITERQRKEEPPPPQADNPFDDQ